MSVNNFRDQYKSRLDSGPIRQTILFFRNYVRFSGGHLKVWDYFNHVNYTEGHISRIIFSSNSSWDPTNPWLPIKDFALGPEDDISADQLFVAGMDWEVFSPLLSRYDSVTPVINLIQHVRHADRNLPLYKFLSSRAIRICVSQEVADAIIATKRVNGPVFVIPNGLALNTLPKKRERSSKSIEMLIAATKMPKLGRNLSRFLLKYNIHTHLVDTLIPRDQFLDLINRSRIAVFLPNLSEGFYLPALEAMALGTLVICPDCVGNRTFCIPQFNCFRPDYTWAELIDTIDLAIHLRPPTIEQMLLNAAETALEYDIVRERRNFIDILDKVPQLW